MNPCSDYGYSNYSSTALGCQRNDNLAQYGEANPDLVRKFSDPKTTPLELLLFFHNIHWEEQIPIVQAQEDRASSTASVSLFQYICNQHAKSLGTVDHFIDLWRTTMVSEKHDEDVNLLSKLVLERFYQQQNDAGVFSRVLLGYYEQISGLKCANKPNNISDNYSLESSEIYV